MTASLSADTGVAISLIDAAQKIPQPTLNSARLHLLDALAVGVLAARHGPVTGVTQLEQSRNCGQSSVLGREESGNAAIAALINGTLIHSLEFDDTHVASVMHGSSVLASTALACAENEQVTVGELIRAFTIGWEFLIRIGLASPGKIQANGFQITSAGGPFASATVACLLNKDSADVMSNAIGIAGSQVAGTFAFLAEGDTVKAVQPGWAAHAGILAADLARAGVTGPADVFRGDFGFYSLYARDHSGGQRLLDSIENLGELWYLPEAAFKLIPSCHYIHPFVEAVHQAIDSGLDWREINNLHCWVPAEVTRIIAEPWSAKMRPRTSHDARWSLPYVLAAVLLDGDVGVQLFSGPRREEVTKLAELMTFQPWVDSGYPEKFPARIRVTFRDNTNSEYAISDVKGGAGRPIQKSDVVDKAFRNLEGAGWDASRINGFIDLILQGDETSVSELSAFLRFSQ